MTYSVRNVVGISNISKGKKVPKGLLFDYDHWPYWGKKLYDYLIACHVGHLLDFIVAFICYKVVFPSTFQEATEFKLGWMAKIVAFNVAVEFTLYSFWHHMLYASKAYSSHVKPHKYNQTNQYEATKSVGYLSSTSGQLQREVFLSTSGFLISSCFQIVMTYLWANKYVPCYLDFWQYPVWSLFWMAFVTYWREFHFYWIHRAMHPWWSNKGGLHNGDIGAFLYRHFHSLHHKSYNPGPWSGLAMHPVEHLMYYTCTLIPLFVVSHPMHFLFAKFHADIAPIGGHDGFADPGGDADFHYLHHAKFEVNYGVPLIDFDTLFGTTLEYSEFKKSQQLKEQQRQDQQKQTQHKQE